MCVYSSVTWTVSFIQGCVQGWQCLWQTSRTLRNLLLAPILSSSVGGVGFTSNVMAYLKHLSYFQLFDSIEFALTVTATIKDWIVNIHSKPSCSHNWCWWRSRYFRSLFYVVLFSHDMRSVFQKCSRYCFWPSLLRFFCMGSASSLV